VSSVTTTTPPDVRREPPAAAAALAGVLGVGVALATVELLAGTTTRVASAVDAVSQQVIPRTPEPVTRWAIDTFGTADIAVLNAGTTLLALLVGAAAGLAGRRGLAAPAVVFAAFAGLGAIAATARAEVSLPLTIVTSTIAVGLGLLTVGWLLGLAAAPPVAAEGAAGDRTPGPAAPGRRRFLRAAAGVGAAAVVAAATGRAVLRGGLAVVDPTDVGLPEPARALPDVPSAAAFDVDGLAPILTPNDRFYVIDTAVATPQIDPATWSLRIHGLVDRELTLTYDDLLGRRLEEFDVTLSCVSNEVGGSLVGTARWLGVRLDDLLEEAGVRPEAEQVMGRSTDGFTAGFPVEAATDGRDAILAVAMNGEPLPTTHGFPARLVVPGLYGYVSATKWLAEIELTTWDDEGYWIPRGWAREGPIKTQSRIDVPRRGSNVDAGAVVVAGVAWAPLRGVDRVEVRLDGGDWREAELSEPLSAGTWVQWRLEVDAEAGDHELEVRATDGDGETQGREPVAPAPDGAEGWHRTTFRAA
jgi:DMSO/TMAO reductase YedYZ molybdopterin-dependent catalytic subunit